MTYEAILPAPFGAIGIHTCDDCLTGLTFLPPGTPLRAASTRLIKNIAAALDAYYAEPNYRFSLALAPQGTPFRLKVWHALEQISAGSTLAYGDIARQLGTSPRAVGQAVGDNPIPIIIPCHRVIAADGSLGGFMHSRTGYSQDIKRWLLKHEHVL
jgi:methylated-DNA-[protein]-cysteine S-methyltransferase